MKTLTLEQLQRMDELDKVKYIVQKFFKGKSFSATEVSNKLNSLYGKEVFDPIETHEWLVKVYGLPGGKRD